MAAVLALADDLTGALEIGAKFAATGIPSLVTTRTATGADASALAIDTETRHKPASEAAAIVDCLVRSACGQRPALIYKKTDSTLRGNIGAELAALLGAWPGRPLVYVPAYPRMGRIVRDGHLLVDGVRVHLTAFARDPRNPVRESHIPALLASQCDAPVRTIHARDVAGACLPAIYVCDAETGDDLACAAQALLSSGGIVLAAGPAAFAEALAERLDLARTPAPPYPAVRRCALINGSPHELSARQVEHARTNGWPADWPILSPAQFAAAADCDTLIVFGGDTAFAILESLGASEIRPYGEILPGMPFSRLSRPLNLITKAGGFGPVDVLMALRDVLSRSHSR